MSRLSLVDRRRERKRKMKKDVGSVLVFLLPFVLLDSCSVIQIYKSVSV